MSFLSENYLKLTLLGITAVVVGVVGALVWHNNFRTSDQVRYDTNSSQSTETATLAPGFETAAGLSDRLIRTVQALEMPDIDCQQSIAEIDGTGEVDCTMHQPLTEDDVLPPSRKGNCDEGVYVSDGQENIYCLHDGASDLQLDLQPSLDVQVLPSQPATTPSAE